MAVPSLIGQPEAFILYSRSQDAFDTHVAILNHIGQAVYEGTDPGRAALYDLALLSGMYSQFAGFLQAAALVGTEKVKVSEFTSSMLIPWLEAMLTTLPEMAKQIDKGNYESSGSNLEMRAVALENIRQVGKDQGISTGLLDSIQLLMDRRVAAGYGGDDFSSIIELIKNSNIQDIFPANMQDKGKKCRF